MNDWRMWLHGLAAAVIGAAASGVSLAIVDPTHFNLSKGGLIELAQVCAVQALIAASAYLKQSPLPPEPPK